MPGKRVVVCDDEDILLDMMMEFCEDIGVAGIPASTGADAIEKTKTKQPDAVLLDNRLPDMSGLDVLSVLKADPATAAVPVLLLSGDAKLVEAEALSRGAFGVLLKPVTRAALKQALSDCSGAW